ncbi:MAG: hypothetical protein KDD67_03295 [Ignavibacteriae bacterium]|nr:hypothetical protein [Ignavibacteriota bacterium]MCB9217143.1 hypothetical protein [Ignavibacteria bacterium]
MTTQDKQEFIRGFNEGYLIAQHNPLIARYLAQAEIRAPHIEGFRAGWLQYQNEQAEAGLGNHFEDPLQNNRQWPGTS